VFELPECVDPDTVTAETDQGVVCVHIGKRAGVKPKHIAIRPSNTRPGANAS
jgi:HSP20 family molecular chaperone IbpA